MTSRLFLIFVSFNLCVAACSSRSEYGKQKIPASQAEEIAVAFLEYQAARNGDFYRGWGAPMETVYHSESHTYIVSFFTSEPVIRIGGQKAIIVNAINGLAEEAPRQ